LRWLNGSTFHSLASGCGVVHLRISWDGSDWNFSPRQPNAMRDKKEVPRVSSMSRSAAERRNRF
jgi:hypothetical protein